jgi:hypothetical protein
MPTRQEEVHYVDGPDRFSLAASLKRGRKEKRNPITFTLNKAASNLPRGAYKADVVAVERLALINNEWIITANIATSEDVFAKGRCITTSWITKGCWEEFIPCEKVQEIFLPEGAGLDIVHGPSKDDFIESLFTHNNQRYRTTLFSIKNNEEVSEYRCTINRIERTEIKAEWRFKAILKPVGETVGREVIAQYCTHDRSGKLFFV